MIYAMGARLKKFVAFTIYLFTQYLKLASDMHGLLL